MEISLLLKISSVVLRGITPKYVVRSYCKASVAARLYSLPSHHSESHSDLLAFPPKIQACHRLLAFAHVIHSLCLKHLPLHPTLSLQVFRSQFIETSSEKLSPVSPTRAGLGLPAFLALSRSPHPRRFIFRRPIDLPIFLLIGLTQHYHSST